MNRELINKNRYIIIAAILIFGTGAGILGYLQYKNKIISTSFTPSVSPISTPSIESQNNNIIYTKFLSAKADFTFEYPDMWVYDEDKIENTMVWKFYLNPKKNSESMVFEVHSPTYEGVDFCSGKANVSSGGNTNVLVKIDTYKTNDSKTYITYEECGGSVAYIYWQKGERFASADDIKNIYQVNLMLLYFTSDLSEGTSIAQHIAQSIKIK